MTPRPAAKHPKTIVVTVRLSEAMFGDLQSLQERDGIPVSEQIRRALRPWLTERLGKKQAPAMKGRA
jgi:hypothetical protein